MLPAIVFAAAASAPQTPRYVVLHVNVVAYGVAGTGTIAVDRRTGHFARRFDAGPASESEGWNGAIAWRADATGMSRIQANSGERAEIAGWAKALRTALGTVEPHARVAGATDQVDIDFDRYRHADGIEVPYRIVARSAQNGVWSTVVTSVSTPAALTQNAFSPPPKPHDFSLAHVTRLSVSMAAGPPAIEVRVDGVPLRFIVDTGGQNVITNEAAARIGLRVLGRGVVGGGGGGTTGVGYAFARSVRVGVAEMRHQPFLVLSADALPPVDGIVGYELLARFAARLDLRRGTFELAPHSSDFGPPVQRAPFGFFDRQPQVDGSLDGVPGAFSIDTGSTLNAAVQAPFVRAHDLVRQLSATVATYASDVGGKYPIYFVHAHELKMGPASVRDPIVQLLTRANAANNATVVANVGDGLLGRWVLVFDYGRQQIDFRPGGTTSGTSVHDRSGLIVRIAGKALVAQVLGGTPAAAAGIPEGATIARVDGTPVGPGDAARVRRLLAGAPGTVVSVGLADGSTHSITLRKYL